MARQVLGQLRSRHFTAKNTKLTKEHRTEDVANCALAQKQRARTVIRCGVRMAHGTRLLSYFHASKGALDVKENRFCRSSGDHFGKHESRTGRKRADHSCL